MTIKDQGYIQVLQLAQSHGYPNVTFVKLAELTGINISTLRYQLKKAEDLKANEPDKTEDYQVPQLPDSDLPIEQLLAHRKKQYVQYSKAKEAKKLINVKIKIDGPIAISHFGDPHVDDDGTDIGMIEEHCNLINRTVGMYAGNIGDSTNNWVGRLLRLYAHQGTTTKQARMLLEWFINSVPWLYVIYGNHDSWNDGETILDFILKDKNTVKVGGNARMNLQFPNGREVRVNARHNFPGHSMYNTAHGISKAAMHGWRDHILVAGHTHQSGHTVQVDPTNGMISHCLRVASYKIYDRYAEDMGFDNKSISANFVTVINPDADKETKLVHVFYDIEEGAEYLTFLRKRQGHGK